LRQVEQSPPTIFDSAVAAFSSDSLVTRVILEAEETQPGNSAAPFSEGAKYPGYPGAAIHPGLLAQP